MAKSDLLKEAIADARTVKETALANAKIALQEAFAPRLENMLAARLQEELDDEEAPVTDEMGGDEELMADEDPAMAGDEAGMGEFPTAVNVGLDFNDDGEYDLSGTVGAAEEEDEFSDEENINPEDEYSEEEDDLDLQEIIRELEGDMDKDAEPVMEEEEIADDAPMKSDLVHEYEEPSIDEIIESLLREEEDDMDLDKEDELKETKEELEEAYKTVKQMQRVIQEVNLLNAKLLYTNKLFRNFDLNENQKMKVLENFDRANNTREVKLVFSTLAESFNRPTKKRVVKESYASKPVRTTAPSKPILNEGFELADRWKKLAGLL